MAQKNDKKLAFVEGWLSIGINTLLFGLKYWVGVATGSIAILADAWHTLSDSLTSMVVIFGAKATVKPADKEHPFGHGRAELIASLIIGVMLSMVGLNFLMEAINKLRQHESAQFGSTAIIVFIISIVLKEAIADFSFWAGKKINSRSLIADGWHHRSDAIASLLILIGVFLGKYFWWIDGVLGIAVAGLIFYAAFEIIREVVNPLVGEAPSNDFVEKITLICQEVAAREVFLHHIHVHRYGDHTEVTFHLRFPSNMRLDETHEITQSIENKLRELMNVEATIHMEPLEKK